MGITNKIKGVMKSATNTKYDWNFLTEKNQVDEILEASKVQPQFVYKHSHTCSICFLAKKEVESAFEAIGQKADMNFVNVIKARQVSDLLTEKLGVRHESPQVLIIEKEKCIWHESHFSIEAESIMKILNSKV